MTDRSVVIVGLPESGKTTFLAALWHLMTEQDIATTLRLKNLMSGDVSHLHEIAQRWRKAQMQERTLVGGNKMVRMNLTDATGAVACVTFPDIAGEEYRRMWENRVCDYEVADVLRNGNVMFFINADSIKQPQWVVEMAATSEELGEEYDPGAAVQWNPRLSPTQVQIVGILQLLRNHPLDTGPRRLAVMLSAWDKAEGEGKDPSAYLEAKLPLLAQYLRHGADGWSWRVYGLSAQGGEYDSLTTVGPPKAEAEKLRDMDRPSERIALVSGKNQTHDLTEPLAWLME
jgi:hypothetical protein